MNEIDDHVYIDCVTLTLATVWVTTVGLMTRTQTLAKLYTCTPIDQRLSILTRQTLFPIGNHSKAQQETMLMERSVIGCWQTL